MKVFQLNTTPSVSANAYDSLGEAYLAAGKAACAKSCASCHMADLSGNDEIPPLAGPAFMSIRGTRSTNDLFEYTSASMPYGGASLSTETFAAFPPSFSSPTALWRAQALSASTVVRLGSVKPARPTQNAGNDSQLYPPKELMGRRSATA